jgi:hypothetical protein
VHALHTTSPAAEKRVHFDQIDSIFEELGIGKELMEQVPWDDEPGGPGKTSHKGLGRRARSAWEDKPEGLGKTFPKRWAHLFGA